MPPAQLQQRLRLNRPFKMQMQLALRQLAQPVDHIDLTISFPLLPCHLVSVVVTFRSTGYSDAFSGPYLDLRSFSQQHALRLARGERCKLIAVQAAKIDINRMLQDWINHPARVQDLVLRGPGTPLGVTPIVFREELLGAIGFNRLRINSSSHLQFVPSTLVSPPIADGT